MIMLWAPAAAISMPRFALSCPMISAKSTAAFFCAEPPGSGLLPTFSASALPGERSISTASARVWAP